MGILDGIVEWFAEQVMKFLDLINSSVLGALGCNMSTFKRYFPAAETMYKVFVALGIGLILLNLVWQLFKNFGAPLGSEAEDPFKLTLRSAVFIMLVYFADEIVDLILKIGGTPYKWILNSELPPLNFENFNSVLLTILGVCCNGAVTLIGLVILLILAWNYIKLLFEAAFLSSLPLVSLEKHLYNRARRNVLTTGAASCYPFTAYELSDDNGILLGVNKYNNSLVIVDIFNSAVYRNANIAIVGTSGAGKTFTMQLMALRMRRKGIQVFIIVPLKGHEFLRACKNIGGEFIQISPASKNCINIMEIRKTDKSADEIIDGGHIEKSELAKKIQSLHIFFSLLIPDMTHEEKQLLDEALVKTYGLKGITHDNKTLADKADPERYKEMPVLGDLYNILISNASTERLGHILNRLVHGSAGTFNQQTNVNLDNKYTVFDISELSGDLLPVGMFTVLDYVWDKAKEDRTAEKAIYVDEMWQLIGSGGNQVAAGFVLEMFKIIRGYGGSAICATQDLNDFFALDGGKYGKGIINNCKTKIILNLEDDEAERVKDIFKLSEAEIMEITHFERGSGLISTNNNNITVEFKCSELEKRLITTDRRELKQILDGEKTDMRS